MGLTVFGETDRTSVMPKSERSAIQQEVGRQGITQEQIAKALGISQAQISQRMRGEVDWRLSELRIVAELLDVPLASLVEEAAS